MTKDDKDGYFEYNIDFNFFYFLISRTLNTIFEHLTIYYYSPFHQLIVIQFFFSEEIKKEYFNIFDLFLSLLFILIMQKLLY